MGLFSGPRVPRGRPFDVDAEQYGALPQRAMSLPWPTQSPSVDYSRISLAGTGSMQSVAIRSSIDLICSLVSELPIDVFRGDGATQVELPVPGNLLDPARDGNGLQDWIYQLLQSWLARGNVYGEPIVDRLGYFRGLSLHDPDSVGVMLDQASGIVSWNVNGRPARNAPLDLLTGVVGFDAGGSGPGLLHSRVNPMAGILLGFSPVEAHAVTILTSIAAGRFGAGFLTEGTHPHALLVNTESPISADEARVVLSRWRAMKSGTREPAVLGKGWEFRALSITPEESQFLATMGFSEAQCCRIFGAAIAETLGYESGGSMTYSNVTDRRSDLLVLNLNKWTRRVERLLSAMLPKPQYARFNRDALLESTTAARYAAHAVALSSGFKTINEVREDEDLPPLPNGGPSEPTDPDAAQEATLS